MGRKLAKKLSAAWLLSLAVVTALPAFAETSEEPAAVPAAAPSPVTFHEPYSTSPGADASIAQATQEASESPIELSPVKLPERPSAGETLNSFETGVLYRLPGRVFFNANVENSLRLETNILQTRKRQRADMIYRPAPNVTLGYALTRRTRVAANYFFLRDQYTRSDSLLSRNIQSVGMRIDQDIPITRKTTATAGFMVRELFVSHSRWFNDLLPSLSIARPVGYRGYVYGSVIGQLRWFNVFQGFQEGDQFYSLGGVYRRGPWILTADNTFITNFRKRRLAGPNNQMFIMTLEAARRVKPRWPVYAFVRAQPIFNMGANQLGFAGFNFRVFGGLRIDVSKPLIFPAKLARL